MRSSSKFKKITEVIFQQILKNNRREISYRLYSMASLEIIGQKYKPDSPFGDKKYALNKSKKEPQWELERIK